MGGAMPGGEIIYRGGSLFGSLEIRKDGGRLLIFRKNLASESHSCIDLDAVERLEAGRDFTSHVLKVHRRALEPVTLSGLTREALESIRGSLGSLIDIQEICKKKTITMEEARGEAERILGSLSGDFDARIIISLLINLAARLDSSDVHLNPGRDRVNVLLRVDGLLCQVARMGTEAYQLFLSAVKNEARLASYRKSTPQDGSFRFCEGDTSVDVRCATMPTLYGEKMALRILDQSRTPLLLEDLGIAPLMMEKYLSLIARPQGCIILTGPAGSGKTTTIFASLASLYNAYGGALSVATIEDPIEYVMEEFQQTEIKAGLGITFDVCLKSLLRLDPDVILVGEIRDPETAGAAVRAALTGHLLFTTIHARDSLGVFPRLAEMGVSPAMASSAVTGVLYQRLARKVCLSCRKEVEPPGEFQKELETHNIRLDAYFAGQGCPACGGRGYRGRTGVFELFAMDEEPGEKLAAGAGAAGRGLRSLRANALEKAAAGITDYPEVMRICPA
jgi:type II secretory ATPase GspE/PulE/Tfp pilus assembly ATPase PilB-like protein